MGTLNEWLNSPLKLEFIATRHDTLPVVAHDGVVYVPLNLEGYESEEKLTLTDKVKAVRNSEEKKAVVFLIDTEYEFKDKVALFAVGMDASVGEVGKVPVLVLKPEMGLYELHKSLQAIKQQVEDKGKLIVIAFPETEDALIEVVEKSVNLTMKPKRVLSAVVSGKEIETFEGEEGNE